MRCTNHYLTGRLRLAFLPPQSKVTILGCQLSGWLFKHQLRVGQDIHLSPAIGLALSFPTQSAHRHLSTHGSALSPAPDSFRFSLSKHSQGRGNNPAVLPCGPREWGSGKRQMGDSRFHVTWGKNSRFKETIQNKELEGIKDQTG